VSPKTVREIFEQFSDDLKQSLESRPEVIGLVLVGSTADLSRVDQWSDHDFFVITKEGQAENMRQDLSWLPNHESIVLRPRETDHGLKVLYADGHVLEFAIFNDSELELCSANAYSVSLDRADIAARMAAIEFRSRPKSIDPLVEFELLLASLLIGVGRTRRGEELIASQHVRSYCVNHAIALIRAWQQPARGTESQEDNLNRFRRFEFQYPAIGRELNELQKLDVEQSARGLLELVLRAGSEKLSQRQRDQAALIRRLLNWS
jgi:hypothetical protein